jgi:hypothetical protein
MSREDFLEEMFRQLQPERAPEGFSRKVMNEVMTDWSLNPTIYKPVISKKSWWTIGLVTAAFVLLLFIIQNATGETSQDTINLAFFSDFNFKSAVAPVGQLFGRITKLSPAIGIGSLAIIALWFFDQLLTRLARN